MNMQPKRDALAPAQAVCDQDLLTCALQLLGSALKIIDSAPVPGEIGAHVDHAVQLLAEHLVSYPGAAQG